MKKSCFYFFSSLVPFTLTALPQEAIVKKGQAEFILEKENTLYIHASDKAVIHYRDFSLDPHEKVQFIQPGKQSTVLNRVEGNNPSQILGTLKGNGKIFLVNPQGVYFGKEASVDVGSLVASALDILDTDFLQDHFAFFVTEQGVHAKVVNEGRLTASPEGAIVLLAPHVENQGQIHAEVGKIILASVEQATIDFSGDGLISFSVKEPSSSLSFKEARKIVQEVVNTDGFVLAEEMIEENGIVRLIGSSVVLADQVNIIAPHVHIEGEIGSFVDLTIQAQEVVCLRDQKSQPLKVYSYRDMRLESSLIDILAWQHPETTIASGRHMTFISEQPISADGRFFSGGDFSFLTPLGALAPFESLFDPIVTSVGSVSFGTYTGPSLKVEAGGNITATGDITITGPDAMACPAGFCMSDPDCTTLTTQAALILIAGQAPVSMSCNPVPVTFSGTMFTNPGGTGSFITLSGNLSGFETATFTGAVVLGGATVITSTGGMTFNGTIDGAFGLTLIGNGINTITVTQEIGGNQPLSSLTVSGSMSFFSGAINSGLVTLGDMTTFTVNVGPLTTTTSGGMTITGNGNIRVADATVSGGGGISLNLLTGGMGHFIDLSGSMVADADITMTSAEKVQLYGTTSLTSNTGSISITGTTVGDNGLGNQSLTLSAPEGNATITSTMSSSIGTFTSFSILATTSATLPGIVAESGGVHITGNSLVLSGNIATTAGPIIINAPLLLAGPIAMTSMNAPISLFDIDNAQTLLIDSGSAILAFNGEIGGTTPLTSLTATGNSISLLRDITVTGAINFTGSAFLLGDVAMTSIMSGIAFNGTIDGLPTLALNVTDQPIVILDNIGSQIPLESLTATHFLTFTSKDIHAGSIHLDNQMSSMGTVQVGNLRTFAPAGISITAGDEIHLKDLVALGSGNIDVLLDTSGMGDHILLEGATVTAGGSIVFNSNNGTSAFFFKETTITSGGSITITASEVSPFSGTPGLTLNAEQNITIGPASILLTAGFLNSTSGNSSVFPEIITTTGNGVVMNAGTLSLNGNITTTMGNGQITLNTPLTFTASRILNAGSGNVTLGGPVTSSSALAALTVIGNTINQNATVLTNSGALAYTGTLVNLGDSITTNGGPLTITAAIVLNGAPHVTLDTQFGGSISLNGTINAGEGRHSLAILSGTALVTLSGNVGNTAPLEQLSVTSSNINFFGTRYAAKSQTYTATGNFNFTAGSFVSLESFGRDIKFNTGTIQLGSGTDFLVETGGGDFSFPALLGTTNENIDIFADTGTVTLGSMGMGTTLNSILVSGQNIFFTAPITSVAFSATAKGAIQNQNSPQLITTQGNALFNAFGGAVGSQTSPLSVASSFLIFAGAPRQLANLIGIAQDNTVHPIVANQPCPLIFNGITLISCPALPSAFSFKIPARDFYVPGIYSQYDSLAGAIYFLPEVVTPSYIKLQDLLLYITEQSYPKARPSSKTF